MAAQASLLLVEDEAQYRRLLRVNLKMAGYAVREAKDWHEALAQVYAQTPDLILLDLWLPDGDGLEGLPRLRQLTATPIIIVSARDRRSEIVRGLDLGADDYLVKPFSVEELLARVRAVLRRTRTPDPAQGLTVGPFRLDPLRREVSGPRGNVRLTPLEWRLAVELFTHPERALTRDYLLAKVWGEEYLGEETYLRVYMRRLRQALEPDPSLPRYLVTIPGVGYGLFVDQAGAAGPDLPRRPG